MHSNGEKTAVSLEPAIYAYDKDQLPLRLLSEDQTSYLSPAQLAPPEKGEVYLPIDFGIMKAIGFRNSITRQIFSLRFIAVAVIGLILGHIIFNFAANPLLNKLVSLTRQNLRYCKAHGIHLNGHP